MNNAHYSLDNPDLELNSVFDTGLKIFTAVFFITFYCWLNFNASTDSNSKQLSKADLNTVTKANQPVNYSNAMMGFDLNKIRGTVSKGLNSIHELRETTPCPDEKDLKATELIVESPNTSLEIPLAKKEEKITPNTESYILNKSLANNDAVGPSDFIKEILEDNVKSELKAEKAEKKDAVELVDGSELLIISLNEMHTLKLPANTEMTFVESDGNEFSSEKKTIISEEEKKATLDAVPEIVKGDELAFISEKELDEIKIVETVGKKEIVDATATNDFVVKGIQDRSDVLYNALELASAENKVVMISFGAKWCLPCREMYKNVFPAPEVKSLIDANYLWLKMDANDLEAISIKQIYDVKAYPTTLFIAPNGEEMDRYETGISLAKMITILNQNTLQNRPEFANGNELELVE